MNKINKKENKESLEKTVCELRKKIEKEEFRTGMRIMELKKEKWLNHRTISTLIKYGDKIERLENEKKNQRLL